MKKLRIGLLVLGLVMALTSVTQAAFVDTKQFPTGYFLDVDANKYLEGPSGYWRHYDQDWGWQHSAIAGTWTSATLNIAAFDVDFPAEVDNVYAKDEGLWTLLGALTGHNDQWEFGNSFNLGSNFANEIATGLEVWVDISAPPGSTGWYLTLSKSSLSIDGGQLPDPDPGTNPVPEPSTMLLLGGGLAGLAYWRKRKNS